MKKHWLQFIKNKYIAACLLFLMCRIELNSLCSEVDELEDKNAEAKESLIELSTNMVTLEKFARETYYMKRDNEDVFVFKERAE